MVAHQQLHLGLRLGDEQHAAVGHGVDVAPRDVHQLDGALHHYAFRHIHHEAILRQHGVEGDEAILLDRGRLAVVATGQLGMLLGEGFQASHVNALGQKCLRKHLVVEGVVHHEIEQGAQVGHVALEHVVGVHGDGKPLQVQSVIGSERLLDVGIFVVLALRRGKALPLEAGQRRCAQRVHRGGAIAADQVLALGEQLYILFLRAHIRHLPSLS